MQNHKKKLAAPVKISETKQIISDSEDLENEKFISRLEIQRKLLMNFIDMANSDYNLKTKEKVNHQQ